MQRANAMLMLMPFSQPTFPEKTYNGKVRLLAIPTVESAKCKVPVVQHSSPTQHQNTNNKLTPL